MYCQERTPHINSPNEDVEKLLSFGPCHGFIELPKARLQDILYCQFGVGVVLQHLQLLFVYIKFSLGVANDSLSFLICQSLRRERTPSSDVKCTLRPR